jgi:hypothetical protein
MLMERPEPAAVRHPKSVATAGKSTVNCTLSSGSASTN